MRVPLTRPLGVFTALTSVALAGVLLTACGGGDEEATAEVSATDAAVEELTSGPVELLKMQETTILDQRIEYPKKKQARITSDIAVLEPGQETGWRRYKVPVYVYVMEGTLTVEYETAVTRDFAAGTAFVQATGTDFNGINKGETPVRLLQVFMGVKGTKNIAVR